jgi:hypothetical protein
MLRLTSTFALVLLLASPAYADHETEPGSDQAAPEQAPAPVSEEEAAGDAAPAPEVDLNPPTATR